MRIKLGLEDLVYTLAILKCKPVCEKVLEGFYITNARLEKVRNILLRDCYLLNIKPLKFTIERKSGEIKCAYRVSNYKNRVWVRIRKTYCVYILFKFDYSYRRFERTLEILKPFVSELHLSASSFLLLVSAK